MRKWPSISRGGKSGFLYANGSLFDAELGNRPELMGVSGDLLRIRCRSEEGEHPGWGVYDLAENTLVQACKFDSIGPFEGGFARAFLGGQTGLINGAGLLVVPLQYDEIHLPGMGHKHIFAYSNDSMAVYSVSGTAEKNNLPVLTKNTAVSSPSRPYWPAYEEEAELVYGAAPAPRPNSAAGETGTLSGIGTTK